MNVVSTATLADVNVTVNISHSWVNDMTVTLISPAGTQVQLVANPCTSASIANIVATFDNAGVNVVCGNNPAISGTVIPIQTLSAFNGESANGNWTLRVLDSFNEDGGSINGWSLNLCSAQTALAVNENSLENFVLYPNPNKGNFTVQFNSASGSDVSVAVNDMRGRQIFKKAYQNTGLFSQNLQLDSVQAGVYLVTVQDGDKKVVKRIIIE
jgi:subtilisin-like proprotein convertase family protein